MTLGHLGRGLRVGCAVWRTLGRPVLARSLTTIAALLVPVAIIFSPQGLSARDLVAAIDRVLLVRAAVWAGWIWIVLPTTRLLFEGPGARTLRSLVRPSLTERAALVAALTSLAVVVELPWFVLFARGSGFARAAVSVALALGIASAWAAGPRGRWLAFLQVVAAVAGAPIFGAWLAPASIHVAWVRAPERSRSARAWIRSSWPPLLALTLAHLLRLMRVDRLRLVGAIAVMSVGAGGLLTLRSAPTEHPVDRALAVMSLPIVLTAALLVEATRKSERDLRPILASVRAKRVVVAGAFVAAIATPTTALAAGAAVATTVTPFVPVAGAVVTSAWVLSIAVAAGARLVGRWRGR